MSTVAASAVTPTVGVLLRRWRFWGVVLACVLLVVVVQLVATATGRIGTVFDPGSSAPQGGRALAQVLRAQGVTVREVRRLDAATASGGTLLVDDADGVLPARAWSSLTAGRPRTVVVSPSFATLRRLAPGVRSAGHPQGGTGRVACTAALAQRSGPMSLGGLERSLRATGAAVCFRDRRGAGQLVTLRSGGTRLLLLADRVAFTNERIGAAGNAAVALNALGSTDRLTWYAPDAAEFAGSRTLQDLTPPWVTPVALLLLLAGFAAALWRGRRLGPIVVERLPVTVRSRETVEGRARLYERGRARLRAADALRIGAIGRLAPVLGLPSSAAVDEVVVAAARATGSHRDRVTALLLTDQPQTDRDLVRISDDLARLEAAARAAVLPGSSATKGSA